jgi:hypothetical protein
MPVGASGGTTVALVTRPWEHYRRFANRILAMEAQGHETGAVKAVMGGQADHSSYRIFMRRPSMLRPAPRWSSGKGHLCGLSGLAGLCRILNADKKTTSAHVDEQGRSRNFVGATLLPCLKLGANRTPRGGTRGLQE